MAKYDYNTIVIGAGSGGLVSAYIAAAVKAKVALIEQGPMGGDCLNTGCVPSKALLRSAKILGYAKRAEAFGFQSIDVTFNFEEVMKRVHNVIKAVAPHDSRERYTQLGVDCLTGKANITSPHSVSVNGKTLTARAIIVATGANPLIPPIPGLDAIDYLTSDTIWTVKSLPKRLLVLGGGPIGCEMAQAFTRLGSTVTVVEMAEQLLVREDKEVIEQITSTFVQEGIRVLTGHKATSFKGKTLACEHQGNTVSIDFDQVLVCLGRKPMTDGLGLEALGVKQHDNGCVTANPFLQTTVSSIYVCGDVAGPYQFTHMAAHQAWYSTVNALFSPFKRFKVNNSVVPWVTFTDPEVARVGLNEKEAVLQGIPHEVTTYSFSELDRAIADSETHGFIKLITPPGKDKLLGATIVGAKAGELIAEYILAMTHGIGLNKILNTLHVYPTFSEADRYAAGEWKKAHVSSRVLNVLAAFHRWRRS